MNKTMGFDLSALDTKAACNKPFKLELRHPVTREKVGIYFTLVGKDSDAYDSRARAYTNESLAGRNKDVVTLDDIEAKNIDALMAATVGWGSDDQGEGKVLLGGEVLDFNPANLRKVYSTIKPAREQVQEAVNDLGNFMTG